MRGLRLDKLCWSLICLGGLPGGASKHISLGRFSVAAPRTQAEGQAPSERLGLYAVLKGLAGTQCFVSKQGNLT